MARIRPARTFRNIDPQAWTRYSQKKPRKNYVRAMPHTSLLVFKMGTENKNYDLQLKLNVQEPIQLRSNSLEAARQIANRYLENNIPGNFLLRVLVYPHIVIREHKMASGAGADRISQGMNNAFGKPTGIAARMKKGQSVFMIATMKHNLPHAKEAFRRAASKLSGHYKTGEE